MNYKLTAGPWQVTSFLSFFVFMPLYFNLSDPFSGFIWLDENTVHQMKGVPMPIGALAMGLLILSFNLFPGLRSTSIYLIQTKRQLIFVCIAFLIIFYLLFSNLPLVRAFQLLSPVLLLMFVRAPSSIGQLLTNIFSACAGTLFFQLLHLADIITNGSFVESTNIYSSHNYAFVRFYGSVIYSGLVSYPAVIDLCIVASLVAIHLISNQTHYRLSAVGSILQSKPFYLFVLCLQIFYLSFLSRKVTFLEAALVLMCSSSVFILKAAKNKISKPILSVICFLLLVAFLIFSFDLPIMQRLLHQSDSVADDRIDKYVLFLEIFFSDKSNVYDLFLGFGGNDPPGLHNFFLDTIFRVGLLGLIPLVLVLVVCILQPIAHLYSVKPPRSAPLNVASYLLLASLFVGNTVNTQVTQPIYASSLVFCLSAFAAVACYNANKADFKGLPTG